MKRKKLLQNVFDLTINFDIMIILTFFDLITWESLMIST